MKPETTGEQIAALARQLVGVPFKHQGRSPFGLDCIGLVVLVLERAGILPPGVDRTDYGRRAAPDLARLVEEHCSRAHRAEAGLLILIHFPRARMPQHVAICAGATMIHADQRKRAVVEHGYQQPWLSLTTGLYRLPGVKYE